MQSSAIDEPLLEYLRECRNLVIEEIQRIIPEDGRYGEILYQLMLDYPLREAKGLRPTLSIATCRALGGKLEAVLRSAAVLELYHNAFLIHDDIEDESVMRRGAATLHRDHGVPIAVNVGDAMFCLSLQPLLDNIGVIGLGPSLRILQSVARMTRESVEGQALELDWVRRGAFELTDDDYVRMVEQKTGWYSFMTPLKVGAITAGADRECIDALAEFGRRLAIAFQIQDDVLSLQGEPEAYGKEIGGDLWEGKRTLILLHMMRRASADERAEVAHILSLPQPGSPVGTRGQRPLDLDALLEELVATDQLTDAGRDRLRRAGVGRAHGGPVKTTRDVRRLYELVRKYDSIDYAAGVAEAWAADARESFDTDLTRLLRPSVHRDVLDAVVDYVHQRRR